MCEQIKRRFRILQESVEEYFYMQSYPRFKTAYLAVSTTRSSDFPIIKKHLHTLLTLKQGACLWENLSAGTRSRIIKLETVFP